MGEIRFVGTGETRGYPYLVCKKKHVVTLHKKHLMRGHSISMFSLRNKKYF